MMFHRQCTARVELYCAGTPARLPAATPSAPTPPPDSPHPWHASQAAIDACSGRCGRVVVDLPGSYLTGGLLLTDCVHLEIPAGVALLASDRVRCACGHAVAAVRRQGGERRAAMRPQLRRRLASGALTSATCCDDAPVACPSCTSTNPPPQREDYGATPADWYALRFHRCDRCSLSGAGTIDGQAYRWCKGRWCDQAATSSAGAAAAAGGQASTASTAGAGAGDAGEAAVGGDAPRPARNWQDAACADPELCRPRLLGVLSSGDIQISGVRLTGALRLHACGARAQACLPAWLERGGIRRRARAGPARACLSQQQRRRHARGNSAQACRPPPCPVGVSVSVTDPPALHHPQMPCMPCCMCGTACGWTSGTSRSSRQTGCCTPTVGAAWGPSGRLPGGRAARKRVPPAPAVPARLCARRGCHTPSHTSSPCRPRGGTAPHRRPGGGGLPVCDASWIFGGHCWRCAGAQGAQGLHRARDCQRLQARGGALPELAGGRQRCGSAPRLPCPAAHAWGLVTDRLLPGPPFLLLPAPGQSAACAAAPLRSGWGPRAPATSAICPSKA